MQYALIQNGTVVNVIEADAQFAGELQGFDAVVEAGGACIGWTWDGQALAPPQTADAPPQEPAPAARRITRLAFRNRFTAAEKVALELASLDDPAAPMAQRQQAAMLRVNLDDIKTASWIDLDLTDTRAGVRQMQALGLLAQGRADEILDAPVRPEEMPQ
ncbi:MAG: hypothetical protein FWG56_12020 [Desulfovibrionaceae bacterium]|jgi:hypothetical protein|nr:hypothetical protein [Desulfovibrionaceae bacterium]